MTSNSPWDFSSYYGMSCSNSVTFYCPLSKGKAASLRNIKWVSGGPKVVRNKLSAFPSSIPHYTWRYWFPASSWHQWAYLKLLSLCPASTVTSAFVDIFIMTYSPQANFIRCKTPLKRFMRQEDISAYTGLDLLFLRDCSVTNTTLLPWSTGELPDDHTRLCESSLS